MHHTLYLFLYTYLFIFISLFSLVLYCKSKCLKDDKFYLSFRLASRHWRLCISLVICFFILIHSYLFLLFHSVLEVKVFKRLYILLLFSYSFKVDMGICASVLYMFLFTYLFTFISLFSLVMYCKSKCLKDYRFYLTFLMPLRTLGRIISCLIMESERDSKVCVFTNSTWTL